MTPAIERSFAALVSALDGAEWCIIGGAATALYLDDWTDVHDIDVVVPAAAIMPLMERGDVIDKSDGGTARFRSSIYAEWSLPFPVDFLADMEINDSGTWRAVRPQTRRPMVVPGGTAWVASPAEHVEITRLLGRRRDFEKIARLQAAGIA